MAEGVKRNVFVKVYNIWGPLSRQAQGLPGLPALIAAGFTLSSHSFPSFSPLQFSSLIHLSNSPLQFTFTIHFPKPPLQFTF